MPAPRKPSRFRKLARRGIIGATIAIVAGTIGWMALHKEKRFEPARSADAERIVRSGEPIQTLKPFSRFTVAPHEISKVQSHLGAYVLMLAAGEVPKQDIYQAAIADMARVYGISPALALSLAHTENRFNETGESKKGALGQLQILPETFQEIEKRGLRRITAQLGSSLSNPLVNIDAGLSYLRWIFDRLSTRPDLKRIIIANNFTKEEAAKLKAGTADPLLEARLFDYFMKYALYGYSTGPYAELPKWIDRNAYVKGVMSSFGLYESFDVEAELRNLVAKSRIAFPSP